MNTQILRYLHFSNQKLHFFDNPIQRRLVARGKPSTWCPRGRHVETTPTRSNKENVIAQTCPNHVANNQRAKECSNCKTIHLLSSKAPEQWVTSSSCTFRESYLLMQITVASVRLSSSAWSGMLVLRWLWLLSSPWLGMLVSYWLRLSSSFLTARQTSVIPDANEHAYLQGLPNRCNYSLFRRGHFLQFAKPL